MTIVVRSRHCLPLSADVDADAGVELMCGARRNSMLADGAIVTGGGLLALRWRIPGIVQLVVLGAGAGLLALSASGG